MVKKNLLFSLPIILVSSYILALSFSYTFLIASPAILFILYYCFSTYFYELFINLTNYSKKNFIIFFAILFGGMFYSYCANISICKGSNLYFANAFLQNPLTYFDLMAQVLNEEVIWKVLLFIFHLKYPKPSLLFLFASIFTVLHFVGYSLVFKGLPNINSLITIFLFAYFSSFLFLKYKNFLMTYALHLGWNTFRYGGSYYKFENGHYIALNSLELLNIFEGNYFVILTLLFVFIFLLIRYFVEKYYLGKISSSFQG